MKFYLNKIDNGLSFNCNALFKYDLREIGCIVFAEVTIYLDLFCFLAVDMLRHCMLELISTGMTFC